MPEYANLSSITGNRRGRMTITFQARMDGRGSIDHVNIGIVAYCNQGYAVSDQFYVYYLGSTRGVRKTNVSIDDAVANIALSYCR